MEKTRVKKIIIAAAILLTLIIIFLQLGLPNFVQVHAAPDENVKVLFHSRVKEDKTEEQVQIQAMPSEQGVQVTSIELPSGGQVMGTTASYQATENGSVTFKINYKIPVADKTSSTDIESTTEKEATTDKEPVYEEKQQTATYEVTGIQPVAEQENQTPTNSNPGSTSSLEQEPPLMNELEMPQTNQADTATTYTSDAAFTIDNSGTITHYDEDIGGTDLVIPPTIKGKTVKEIGSYAFGTKNLTSVTIPSTVTNIRNNAFYYNKITRLTLSEGLQTIGPSAFRENQLTSVTIPSTVTRIDFSAFQNNKLTKMPTLPKAITTIPADFVKENQLTNVVIPSTVTSIGDGAFETNQITSVSLPEGLKTIGKSAFMTNQLANVTIPSDVTSIGDGAFQTNKLTEMPTLPSAITTIPANFFKENQLTNVAIPSTVTSIGDSAFETNPITSVSLPDGLKTIGKSAFAFNQLTKVQFPEGLQTIGNSAFNGNKITNLTIPSTVTSIENYAFQNNQISELHLPETLQTIGVQSFSENKLTSVTIPNTVTSLGNYAFQNNQISELQLSEKLQTIGEYAFSENKLTKVMLPSKVTNIGDNAFEDNQLSFIQIPDSVTTLGNLILHQNKISGLIYLQDGSASKYKINLKDQIPDFNPANYKLPANLTETPFSHMTDISYDNQTGILTFSSDDITNAQFGLIVANMGNQKVLEGGGQDINRSVIIFNGLKKPYNVTLNLQGGQFVDPNFQETLGVVPGAAIGKEIGTNDVTYQGYDFAGWYTDAACTVPFNIMTDPVNSDMTLYAKWAWRETQDPSVLISIPKQVELTEIPAEHVAKQSITIGVIYNQFNPTKNILINTQTTATLTSPNTTDTYLVDMLKPDGTPYSGTDKALMILNSFGNVYPTSNTFTVKTPLDPTKAYGFYKGTMTYTVTLE